MPQIEDPAEPSVPQPDETILSLKAKEKFDEAMLMGEYLISNMKGLVFSALQQDQNAVAKESSSSSTVTKVW